MKKGTDLSSVQTKQDTHASAFREAYKRLNVGQKKAVDTIEGPVMVVAGPGTGKTQILTLRIANILKNTDTKPENILALTFTESGARAMRERLRGYIGSEAYRVPIYTFHGFAGMLISAYPESYERIIGGRPARDIEKIEIFEQILDDSSLKTIRPMGAPYTNLTRITKAIEQMKKEHIAPDDLRELIREQEKELSGIPQYHEKGAHKGRVRSEYTKKEKHIDRNKELLFVYRAYEALLYKRKLYDYEDMIIETVRALEKDVDMLRDLQETYQYLLADEHQDVNASQNRIIELIASYHETPNVFVVGDEKQAIFRFQGASLENFLYFGDIYPGTTTITLTDSYRSGQNILDAAHSLISIDTGPAKELRVPLVSRVSGETSLKRFDFSHESVEDAQVVAHIEQLIEEGVSPRECAIIVRTNYEVEQFAALLRKAGIAAQASADGDILSHPLMYAIRTLIDAAARTQSDEALFRTLHDAHWGIPTADLVRIAHTRNYTRPLHAILTDKKILEERGVVERERVMRVGEVLEHARNKMIIDPPHRVLEYLLTESGFLGNVVNSNPLESGRVIRRIYDEVEEMVRQGSVRSLADVGDVLDRYATHGLALTAPYITAQSDAVQVMTAHKAKGLEFTHVSIPHLTDSKWGGSVRAEYFDIPFVRHLTKDVFDHIDDERRLLYVAMTRAKQGLYMSVSETNADGRVSTPTRLFEDIDATLIEEVSTKEAEAAFDPTEALSQRLHPVAIDTSLLRSLFLERGLSATALNNYLKSPWEYLYKNVLRIPEVQPEHLQFGTAVHAVLERVTKEWSATGAFVNASALKKLIEQELGRLPLGQNEFVRLHEKAYESLILYLEHMKSTVTKKTKEEFRLRVILETDDSELPEIPLTGMLDRLDINEKDEVVRVVDYKTGKPKTKGIIEGTTKDSNGDYKRQLVFYALLLSLYDDTRYACRNMVLSFVESDSKGKIREVAYTITDEEIALLKEEIIEVSKNIVMGAFLHESCDPQHASYCDLVTLLRKET